MKLPEILNNLQTIAKDNGLSEAFVCGGVVRDRVLDKAENIDDLDLTTGNEDSAKLSQLFGQFASENGGSFKQLSDHAQVQLNGIKFDFSSHYIDPEINIALKGKKATPMLKEMMSRDFTCNALLMTTDFEKILDPTGLALPDIEKKLLRTCLPAKITLGNDHKRIVRVLYMAAKLGFSVDDEIIKWVSENPSLIADCKPKYLADKLKSACDYNLEGTVELINKMRLWPYVPVLPELVPAYKEYTTAYNENMSFE